MGEFRPASTERVNVFPIGERYLFRHYFEGEDVFDVLKQYYNNRQYRFEVPGPAFDELRSFLREQGYALTVVEELEPFAVVNRKYRAHPENIFKASVYRWSRGDYNCFLLKDREAVETAVEQGATPVSETELDLGRTR